MGQWSALGLNTYFWSSVFLSPPFNCQLYFALKCYGFLFLFPHLLSLFLSFLLPSLPPFLSSFFFFFHVWHQSVKIRLGADCGSDHELLIAKFRLTLKKVGKITRPFRYNQIPYDYTVEETNQFKGLDLIDRVPEELWTEVHDIVQEEGIKTIPKEKKC